MVNPKTGNSTDFDISDKDKTPFSMAEISTVTNHALVSQFDAKVSEPIRVEGLRAYFSSVLARIRKAFNEPPSNNYFRDGSGDLVVDLRIMERMHSELREGRSGRPGSQATPKLDHRELVKRRFFPAEDRPILAILASLSSEGLQSLNLLPSMERIINNYSMGPDGDCLFVNKCVRIGARMSVTDPTSLALTEAKDSGLGSIDFSPSDIVEADFYPEERVLREFAPLND